jgi:hypothetical protein
VRGRRLSGVRRDLPAAHLLPGPGARGGQALPRLAAVLHLSARRVNRTRPALVEGRLRRLAEQEARPLAEREPALAMFDELTAKDAWDRNGALDLYALRLDETLDSVPAVLPRVAAHARANPQRCRVSSYQHSPPCSFSPGAEADEAVMVVSRRPPPQALLGGVRSPPSPKAIRLRATTSPARRSG